MLCNICNKKLIRVSDNEQVTLWDMTEHTKYGKEIRHIRTYLKIYETCSCGMNKLHYYRIASEYRDEETQLV